jgi:hypothetical protein
MPATTVNSIQNFEVIFISSKKDIFGRSRFYFKINPSYKYSQAYKQFLKTTESRYDIFWDSDGTSMMTTQQTDSIKLVKGCTYLIDFNINPYLDHRYCSGYRHEAEITSCNEMIKNDDIDFID